MRVIQWLIAVGVAAIMSSVSPLSAAAQSKLIFPSQSQAGSTFSVFFNQWAKRVNDAAKGTGEIEVRDGSTLVNFSNVYDRVMDDVVQIGFGQQAFIAGKFPLTEVVSLPFVVKDNTIGSVALWRLYKTGLLDKEYDQVVPLWLNLLGPNYLHLVKPATSLDNLDGLKVRVTGKVNSRVVQLLGGAPISLSAEDMYGALQRVTIDGAVTSWSAFEPFHLSDVAFYHVMVPLGTSPAMFFMSRKKYEALPPAFRAAIDANSGEAQSRAAGDAWKRDGLRIQAALTGSGRHAIADLTPRQETAWQTQIAPAITEWTNNVAGGAQVLQTFRALYATAEAGQ